MKNSGARRRTLAHLDELLNRNDGRTWLIIGDFDRLKDVNNLFGSGIVDILLELSHQVIEDVLRDFECAWDPGEIEYTLSGDEAIIVIPPSLLKARHIEGMLDRMRREIEQRLNAHLFTFALPGFAHFLEGMAQAELPILDRNLRRQGISIVHEPGESRALVLSSLESPQEAPRQGMERALWQICQNLPGSSGDGLSGCLEWLHNPHSLHPESFNEGRISPLAISFGAVSSDEMDRCRPGRSSEQETGEMAAALDMVHMAQESLKVSKMRGNAVTVGAVGRPLTRGERDRIQVRLQRPAGSQGMIQLMTGNALFRERVAALRKGRPQGLLLEINPYYHAGCPRKNRESLHLHSARSRRIAFGLKAVNEIYGYAWGDRVIGLLEWAVQQALRESFRFDAALQQRTCIARFVDRFRLFFTEPSLGTRDLLSLMESIVSRFNEGSERLKLFHLAGSLVHDRPGASTRELVDHLEITGSSDSCPRIISFDGSISLRHYVPGIEAAAREMKAQRAFESACVLRELGKSWTGRVA